MLAECFIIGNLGSKPELKTSANGTEFCNFSVATREKSDGKTSWWNVTCFNQSARFATSYLGTGSRVCISGTMYMEKWEDKKTGEKREGVKIIANNIRSLDRKEEAGPPKQEAQTKEPANPFLNTPPETKGLSHSQNPYSIPDLGSIPF